MTPVFHDEGVRRNDGGAGMFALIVTLGVSALAGVLMLGEVLYRRQQRAVNRVEAQQQRDSNRDAAIFAEVEAMKVDENFGGLLQFTNRFEPERIQNLAVQKALSH